MNEVHMWVTFHSECACFWFQKFWELNHEDNWAVPVWVYAVHLRAGWTCVSFTWNCSALTLLCPSLTTHSRCPPPHPPPPGAPASILTLQLLRNEQEHSLCTSLGHSPPPWRWIPHSNRIICIPSTSYLLYD